MKFLYMRTPVAFDLVDFRSDDGRDYEALFGPFDTRFSGVQSVTLTIANADFQHDMYASEQYIVVGPRCREAFEAVGAKVGYYPAVIRCKRGRREIVGRYAVATVDTRLPLLDENASEFEPVLTPEGNPRKRVVQGTEITAIRRLGRYAFRAELDLSSKVFSNAYSWPAVGPYATEDLVGELRVRGCEGITYQDPHALGRAIA